MLLLQVEEEDAESGRFSIDHVVRMCTHYDLGRHCYCYRYCYCQLILYYSTVPHTLCDLHV
jgi:hypothetical protein